LGESSDSSYSKRGRKISRRMCFYPRETCHRSVDSRRVVMQRLITVAICGVAYNRSSPGVAEKPCVNCRGIQIRRLYLSLDCGNEVWIGSLDETDRSGSPSSTTVNSACAWPSTSIWLSSKPIHLCTFCLDRPEMARLDTGPNPFVHPVVRPG
jgi:hypothetical protein